MADKPPLDGRRLRARTALGVPVAFAGAVLTNLPPFLLARYVRTDAGVFGVAARAGERIVDVTGAFRGIVAARLAPSQADVVSYAAGLSGVSTGTYLAGTVVGEIPWIVGAVLAGDSMRTLSVHGLNHSLSLVVAASSLALLLLAGPLYRQFGSVDALKGQ
ncbi:VTT domain-containing protein [Haloarculaceae archaeon H-GB2-1]|nr:VTT domain-containing protein [Haloarculaceae archaeon H-GB11]MEA5408646.1 VTT domain-containing protein [Haloarculaceae archaeon H-GB2-1]